MKRAQHGGKGQRGDQEWGQNQRNRWPPPRKRLMITSAGMRARATCKLLFRIRLIARSDLLRSGHLHADHVLNRVARYSHDNQARQTPRTGPE